MLADGEIVGRIYKANAAPVGSSWMWTLVFWHHDDRSPTDGHAATRPREAAMAAFARSWRREGAALPLARPLALIPAWGLSRLTEARQNGCRAFLGVTPLVTLESKRPAFMAKTG